MDVGSTHLSVVSNTSATTIGCRQQLNTSAALVLAANESVSVLGVEFNGFRLFNASGVELRARRVDLRNVSVADIVVVAESSEDTFGTLDTTVLRSPLAVDAVAFAATDCVFVNNSVQLRTHAYGQHSPMSAFGDWVGGNATTLPVPGGGALACRCDNFAIVSSVFESNSVNVTALSWMGRVNVNRLRNLPGDRSAACGGALLVLSAGSTGNGTLSGCVFRDSLIAASIASGGAVAVVSNGVFRLNVSASSFRDSVIGGSLLSGADLVVVVVGGGGNSSVSGGRVQLDDVAFDGAFVDGNRFNGVVRAPALLIATNVNLSSVACSAEYVECGLVCAVDVDMLNGSIAGNAVESGQSRGVLFGNGQWEDVNSVNTLCSSVALSTTRVVRNRLVGGADSLVEQSCPHPLNNYVSVLLTNVVFADNNATATTALHAIPVLLSAASDVPIDVAGCEFARNVGLSQMFVIRTPSLTMDSTNITDNVLSAFVMDVEFVASSFRGLSSTFSLADIVATGNGGAGFFNAFVGPQSVTSIMIARCTIESAGARQRLLLAAVEPLHQVAVVKSRLMRQVVDIRCWVQSVSVTNSVLIQSSCALSTSQARVTASQSAGVFLVRSTFEDCAPVLGVSDADLSDEFAVRFPLNVLVVNSSVVSRLEPSAAAMFVCDSRAVSLLLNGTTVAGVGGQLLVAASACDAVLLTNVTVKSSGGVAITGPFGTLQMIDTLFDNVSAVLLSSAGATAVLVNVTAVDWQRSGFLFAQAREVNLTNFRFGGSMLDSPALSFSAVGSLHITNASVSAQSVSESGTVSLDDVGRAVLRDVVVVDSLARFGGGFGERALGSVECAGVVARDNLATIAGGAVFSDAPNGSFVAACVAVVNCSAAWWGGSFAGPEERLLVSHDGGDGAMLGIGLRNVRVQVLDRFGQTVRAPRVDPYQSEQPPALRAARLLIFATLSCDDNTEARSLLCVIEPSGAECSGDMPLPVAMAGARCNVSFVADRTTLGAQLSLVVQRCQFGYGAESPERPLCVPCSADTVSVGGESICQPCPLGARCCGVDRVTARPEFYLTLRRYTVAAVACLPGACIGFNSTCADDVDNTTTAMTVSENTLNQCAPGRTGLLCAHCSDPDSVPVAPTNGVACVPCTEPHPAALVALVGGLLAFAAIVHVNAVGESAALKILLYYAQIASAQAPAGLFSSALQLFFGFRVAAASGAFGGICVFAGFSHFSLVAVRLSLPAVLLSGVLLIAVGARLVAHRRRRRAVETIEVGDDDELAVEPTAAPTPPLFGWRRVLRTAVSIVLLTFSVCVSAALDVLHCVQLRDDESFLASDVRQSCESAEALAWRRAAVFGLLPLAALVIVAVPCALLLLRRRHGGQLRHDVAGVLFDCYRGAPCRVAFESFTLLRRLVVGVAAAFVADALLRRFLFTLVNVASLLSVVLVRPYLVGAENHLDAVAQLFLVLIGTMEPTGTGVGDTLIAVGSAIPVVLIGGSMVQDRARKVRAWCGRREKAR